MLYPMTYTTTASSLIGFLVIVLFAVPALAHETDEPHDEAVAQATLDASASGSVDANLPMKPLDRIKAKAREIKEGASGTPGANVELRADGKARVGGEMQNGRASAGNGQGLKEILRIHGGAIKNRFRLAISHMNNLLLRIDTRLGKMEDADVDTTAAAQLKVDAELAVDKAEADAAVVADFVATIPEGSERAAVKAELEAKLRTAHASLKAAHEAVKKAVRALVQLAKDNKNKLEVDVSVSATTTVQ